MDHLGNAPDGRRYDRQAGEHGFDNRHRLIVGPRRKHEQVVVGQLAIRSPDVPVQEHAAANRCRGLARALRAPDGGRRHRTGALRPAAGRPRPPAWPRAARPALCGRSARQHRQFAPECDRHRSVRGRHSARGRIHKGSLRREGDRAGQRPARPSTSMERRSHPRARRRVRPAARMQQDDRCSIHGRSPKCVARQTSAPPRSPARCGCARPSGRPIVRQWSRSRTAAASRRTGSRWKKSPPVSTPTPDARSSSSSAESDRHPPSASSATTTSTS